MDEQVHSVVALIRIGRLAKIDSLPLGFDGQPGSNPPWAKERRLTAREFTGQASPKSDWVRINSVNRVFALTLTLKMSFETRVAGP